MLLTIRELSAGYGPIRVINQASLELPAGGRASLLGANGSGKSTFLRALFGLAQVYSGQILYDDRVLNRVPAFRRARQGIAYVPDNRCLFPEMTVAENVALAARLGGGRWHDLAYETFPDLVGRRQALARHLSGGQQQMLAIARAIALGPRLLLLDEPSLGLATGIKEQIAEALAMMRTQMETAVLLAEQDLDFALRVTDYCYILQNGRVVHRGPSAVLGEDPRIAALYMGATIAE